jgi:PTS system nitrogen regulatory IIA component
MLIQNLLTFERIARIEEKLNKKRVLEKLSELLAHSHAELESTALFQRFVARERLGSTGIGEGIALPHIRLENIQRAYAALLVLDEPIAFDSQDGAPVDIFFALMVPEEATDDHIVLLSNIAQLFNTNAFPDKLRQQGSTKEIYQHLIKAENQFQSCSQES